MLWLAHNEFVDEEPSKSRFHTHSFAIAEFVYFLWLPLPYAEANSRFVMYRVHPSKLTGHKINVIYENFSVLLLTETNVCVHGGKVFMWMQTYRQMYVGELISTGFSIRHVATISDVPLVTRTMAHCIHKDNLVLHGRASGRDSRENCTWIFELDLATMIWTATDTVASDEIREELCSTKHRLCNEENYLVGDKMHVFVRSIETHYVSLIH
ncbi:hypothetical protein PRIPAC_73028 [Pristionchus pacificus]|nr:hypothetical protein PRIPAC_73028 [Pristionchus pacificus]